jgi:hypothetical protein
LQIDRSIGCLLCGTSFCLDCCNEGATNWRQKNSGTIIITVVDSSSSSLDSFVNCFTTVQCHAINRQSCLARVFLASWNYFWTREIWGINFRTKFTASHHASIMWRGTSLGNTHYPRGAFRLETIDLRCCT